MLNLPVHQIQVGAPAPAVPRSQFVAPAVSRAKFDQEVAIFRSREDAQRARGVLLLKAEFPYVIIAFAAPRVRPMPLAFAVRIDFTNYDVEPPSIQFVDPLSGTPLRAKEVMASFVRQLKPGTPPGPNGEPAVQPENQGLLVHYGPEDYPFLCLPGVYEYHNHAAHTGDEWLLHRGLGEGRLGFLVDNLHKYGVQGMAGFVPQVHIAQNGIQGFTCNFGQVMLAYDHHPA
jgi:hypothetical protein